MINDYWLFLMLAISVTAIPGPAVILTIRNSLKYGYRSTVANILGNFAAMVILAMVSAAGLGAVLLTSSLLFSTMKMIGCLYLVSLGVMAWKAPVVTGIGQGVAGGIDRRQFLSLFREGFGVGISNPKAIAFFAALFPQFIDPGRAYIPQFATLIFTIEGVSFIVLSSYALLASFMSPVLSNSKPMQYFNKLTGVVFVGFGVGLVYND